jgi:2-oxoisovalerate dehydrogenase E2 component (dihydrolipoyl transacylase)
MSQVKQFKLPDVGEGLTEAEIVTWKVKPGDTVKVNDIIVEIETAKSLVELPCPFAGVITELHAPEGETVAVGTPIISVDTDPSGAAPAAPETGGAAAAPPRDDLAPEVATPAEDQAVEPGLIGGPAPGGRTSVLVGYGPRTTEAKRRPRKGGAGGGGTAVPESSSAAAAQEGVQTALGTAPAPTPVPAEEEQPVATSAPTEDADAGAHPGARPGHAGEGPQGVAGGTGAVGDRAAGVLAKPPVRKLAKDLGVDLSTVVPSGDGGVVTRADVETAASAPDLTAETGAVSDEAAVEAGTGPAGVRTAGERETRVPIKGVRKATASAMVASAFTAPHVTEFVTVDMTRTMDLVERLKGMRDFRDVKVSPLLVVAKALMLAIRRNPEVNATWDEAAQEIVVKHYVNLGIAAATPRGLMVPNVKDADAMSMVELARALGELVVTAREGKTPPGDMAGGTITITNVGVFGVDNGTPIINPGEAAILCFGAVRWIPWVVEGPDGLRVIEPRQVTQLSLSFDHRLIDGELGSRFLSDVATVLEDPETAFLW